MGQAVVHFPGAGSKDGVARLDFFNNSYREALQNELFHTVHIVSILLRKERNLIHAY